MQLILLYTRNYRAKVLCIQNIAVPAVMHQNSIISKRMSVENNVDLYVDTVERHVHVDICV